MNKHSLRRQLKNKRQALTLQQKQVLSAAIFQQLIQQDFFQQSQHIACYHAVAGEVVTDAIIQTLWQLNKNCYLPIIKANNTHLDFVAFTPTTALQKNRYGIDEPTQKQPLIAAAQLDLVLTPLVAFDAQGHRLGMGAGFYDRTFEFLLTAPQPTKPLLIGLAYDFQQIPLIQSEAWDVPLSAVVTNDVVLIFP